MSEQPIVQSSPNNHTHTHTQTKKQRPYLSKWNTKQTETTYQSETRHAETTYPSEKQSRQRPPIQVKQKADRDHLTKWNTKQTETTYPSETQSRQRPPIKVKQSRQRPPIKVKHKTERNMIYVNMAIPGKPATAKEDAISIREARLAAECMPVTVISLQPQNWKHACQQPGNLQVLGI